MKKASYPLSSGSDFDYNGKKMFLSKNWLFWNNYNSQIVQSDSQEME